MHSLNPLKDFTRFARDCEIVDSNPDRADFNLRNQPFFCQLNTPKEVRRLSANGIDPANIRALLKAIPSTFSEEYVTSLESRIRQLSLNELKATREELQAVQTALKILDKCLIKFDSILPGPARRNPRLAFAPIECNSFQARRSPNRNRISQEEACRIKEHLQLALSTLQYLEGESSSEIKSQEHAIAVRQRALELQAEINDSVLSEIACKLQEYFPYSVITLMKNPQEASSKEGFGEFFEFESSVFDVLQEQGLGLQNIEKTNAFLALLQKQEKELHLLQKSYSDRLKIEVDGDTIILIDPNKPSENSFVSCTAWFTPEKKAELEILGNSKTVISEMANTQAANYIADVYPKREHPEDFKESQREIGEQLANLFQKTLEEFYPEIHTPRLPKEHFFHFREVQTLKKISLTLRKNFLEAQDEFTVFNQVFQATRQAEEALLHKIRNSYKASYLDACRAVDKKQHDINVMENYLAEGLFGHNREKRLAQAKKELPLLLEDQLKKKEELSRQEAEIAEKLATLPLAPMYAPSRSGRSLFFIDPNRYCYNNNYSYVAFRNPGITQQEYESLERRGILALENYRDLEKITGGDTEIKRRRESELHLVKQRIRALNRRGQKHMRARRTEGAETFPQNRASRSSSRTRRRVRFASDL